MNKGESKIPVEDRLFSLVLALLATETGLLKSEILSYSNSHGIFAGVSLSR